MNTPSKSPAVLATITRCRDGNALVVLRSEPFNGLEIRPGALRQLAAHLSAVADMAVRLPTNGKHWKASMVVLGGASE